MSGPFVIRAMRKWATTTRVVEHSIEGELG